MKVVVRLFAGLQDAAGTGELELALPEEACVRDLRRALGEACPSALSLLPSCVFALDAQYCPETAPLAGVEEIACIPPVSGG